MKLNVSFALLGLSFWQVEGRIRGQSTSTHKNQAGDRRKLSMVLVGYGGEPDPMHFPLQFCEGDCDIDAHCDVGLVCFQRNSNMPVPGCWGGENFDADTDFCIPATPNGTPYPTYEPSMQPSETTIITPAVENVEPSQQPSTLAMNPLTPLVFVGDDTFGLPLGLCQGDCDTDEDCLDDFVCFQREMFEPVPACAGRGEASIDYCTKSYSGSVKITPAPSSTPVAPPEPGMQVTQVTVTVSLTVVGDNLGLPLGLCEGDCDTDDDCLDNLICFQRDLMDPVPGCDGSGKISYDYCILEPPTTASVLPPTTSAPVQLPETITMAPSTAEPVVELNPLKPPLVFVGDVYFFQIGNPLGLCEGDCDTDDDCLDNLICYSREGLDPVPFCDGSGDFDMDYCTLGFGGSASLPEVVSSAPVAAVTLPPQLEGVELVMLETMGDNLPLPLGLCQGDCDTDDDCLDELVCFQRDLLDPVPGCIGSGQISYDYCIVSPDTTIAPNTPPTSPPVVRPTNPPAMPTVPLPELEKVGDAMEMPLGLCQGDCDTDVDCIDELVCFQRLNLEPVPGCSGTGSASYDYCIESEDATPAPTWAPFDFPQIPPATAEMGLPLLESVSDGGNLPLGLCQGDCDTDANCLDEMVCFQRDFLEPVPGCYGAGQRSYDYCVQDPFATPSPTGINTPPTRAPFAIPTVSPATPPSGPPSIVIILVVVGDNTDMPLGFCEGDCDTDDDCLDELICFQRDHLEPVPGCSGAGKTSYDYCVKDPFVTPTPTLAPVVTPSPSITLPGAPTATPLPELVEVSDEGTMPLGLCEGDCDTDFDCLDSFICFQRDGLESVPGCAGVGRTSYDYCIVNPNPVAVTPLPTPEPTLPVTQPPSPQPTLPPVTAQPVQILTAQPITAQPITAQPVTMAPVQVVVVIEAEEAPPTPETVISATEEAPAPAPAPGLQYVQGNSKETGASKDNGKLGVCQGICDEDDDCALGLMCFTGTLIPGCAGEPGKKDAFCIPPPFSGRKLKKGIRGQNN